MVVSRSKKVERGLRGFVSLGMRFGKSVESTTSSSVDSSALIDISPSAPRGDDPSTTDFEPAGTDLAARAAAIFCASFESGFDGDSVAADSGAGMMGTA